MKSSAYPPSVENPLYGIPPFLQECLEVPHSMIFQESQHPINKGSSHYDVFACKILSIFNISTKK